MTTPRTRRTKPQQARDLLLALLKDQENDSAQKRVAYESALKAENSTRRMIELLDQAMLPGMEPEPRMPDGEPPLLYVPSKHSENPVYVERPAIIMEAPAAVGTVTTSSVTDSPPGMEMLECVCGYNPENGYRLDVLCVAHPRSLFSVPVGRQPDAPPVGVGKEKLTDAYEPVPSPYTTNSEVILVPPGVNDVWDAKEGAVTVHSAVMYERQDACEWCKKGVPFATEKRTEHYHITRDAAGNDGFAYQPCWGIKE